MYRLKFRPSSHSKDFSDIENYQRLQIRVTLPAKASRENVLLLLSPEEGEILKELFRICGEPQVHKAGREQMWIFTYSGPEIYFPANEYHPKTTIYLDGSHHPLSEAFQVTVLEDG